MGKEVTLLQHMAAGRGKIFCLTQRHFFMLVHTASLWSVMIWVHWTVLVVCIANNTGNNYQSNCIAF